MGGSSLGTEAIYDFLKNKITKKFTFVNNLNPKSKSFKITPDSVVEPNDFAFIRISGEVDLPKVEPFKSYVS